MEVLESPSSNAAREAERPAYPCYLAEYGERVLANGWPIVPIARGSKRPWISSWQKTTRRSARADLPLWITEQPYAGIGLLTGELIGIDLDVVDVDHVVAMQRIVFDGLGSTSFTRIGRAPRLMLVYRVAGTMAPRKAHPIELIGLGGQFVALHVHPDTGRTYEWPHQDPIHNRFDEVPLVEQAALKEVFDGLVAYCDQHALLKQKKATADATQTSLPLQGAAPATATDPIVSVAGATPLIRKQVQKGGRTATEGWRAKLKECATPGNTDRVTGECAASYAATTPLHVLDDQAFSDAALAAANENGLDLAARERRAKFTKAAALRGTTSAVDKHQWCRIPSTGTPVARISLDEAGRKLSQDLCEFGHAAADWAHLREELTTQRRRLAELQCPEPIAPAGYVPPATYAPGQRVSKLEREVDERARWAKANGSALAWIKYEGDLNRHAELIEAEVRGTIDHLRAPLTYAFSTQGVGKTEHAISGLIAFLLNWKLRRMPRIQWGTEAHNLLGSTRDRIVRGIEEATHDPALTKCQRRILEWARDHIYHVRSSAHPGACDDEDRAALHQAFSDTSVSRTRAICRSCPLKDQCETFKVNVLGNDASGVFLLPAVHWGYDAGKYDITGADLAIFDEDVGTLKQVVLTEETLDGTPLAPLISALGKGAVNASNPGVTFEDELPGDALVSAIADHRKADGADALLGWLRELDDEATKLTSQIEALLGAGKQKKARELLGPLQNAMRLSVFSEALLGWHVARNRPSVRLPAFLRANPKGWSVVVQQEKPGLRRTWLTPILALNGTPRVSETIQSMGAWAKGRPTRVVGDQVAPGAGVTHIAVCTDYIGKAKYGDDGRHGKSKASFAYAIERLNALLLAITGSSLVISQKDGEDAMKAIGLAERAACWLTALGRPTGEDAAGRLHFGNQRGHDEFRQVGALLCVGQNLPSVGACELSAAARALPHAAATSSGKYVLRQVPVECADGGFTTAYSWRHTDPLVEAERSRIVTDEVAQAVHRGRAVRRNADDPHLLVTIGTEFGACGVPVDKFLRLVDVYGIRDIDLVAALGVVPATPAALVRSTFGSIWCEMAGIAGAVKAAELNVKRNQLIPEAQALVDSAYAVEHMLGSWRPGELWRPVPTWGVFEARPSAAPQGALRGNAGGDAGDDGSSSGPTKGHTSAYSIREGEIPTHFHDLSPSELSTGHLNETSTSETRWGQHGHKPRWLVKLTGLNSYADPQAAIEAVNGQVRDLVQVATLRPQLSDAQRHALGRLALGTVPRNGPSP